MTCCLIRSSRTPLPGAPLSGTEPLIARFGLSARSRSTTQIRRRHPRRRAIPAGRARFDPRSDRFPGRDRRKCRAKWRAWSSRDGTVVQVANPSIIQQQSVVRSSSASLRRVVLRTARRMTFCACETSAPCCWTDAVSMSCGAFVRVAVFRCCLHRRAARRRSARALPRTPVFAADLPFRDLRRPDLHRRSLDGAAPRTLMLDTGNAHSTLIADVAKELGWTLQPAQRNGAAVPGIYARRRPSRRARRHAGVDDVLRVRSHVCSATTSRRSTARSRYDFFKDRVLEIDYPHHRLRVSNVISTPLPDKPETAGALRLITFGEHGPPVVVGAPFTVNGKTVHAQIDTVFHGHDADLRQRARYTRVCRSRARPSCSATPTAA